jgi:hypothetical protein
MNITIQQYIHFISTQEDYNNKCKDFILQYIDRIDEESIKEMIEDYIRMDIENRSNIVLTLSNPR